MLHLFSASEKTLRYGRDHFRPHSKETSTLLYNLFRTYSEDPDMNEKLKEFARESTEKFLKSFTPEKRMEGLSPEERLRGLSPEEIAKALTPEAREALVRQLKANGSSPKPQ